MKLLAPALLLLLFTVAARAQNTCSPTKGPGAFCTEFNATTKGITIGTDRCIFWRLPANGAWAGEIGCYVNGVLKSLKFFTFGERIKGGYASPAGSFWWTFEPFIGGANNGMLEYGINGVANGSTAIARGVGKF